MADPLLEGPEDVFGDTIGFGFADEGVARGNVPEANLVVEPPGLESAAVIVAERDAAAAQCIEMAASGFCRHADGFRRGTVRLAIGALSS
ncbi:MAG: hypothetical protein M0002_14355 [Rhodospirillales bacterium]|nr:hypothetical protein [Rhodospirillales bacterium]